MEKITTSLAPLEKEENKPQKKQERSKNTHLKTHYCHRYQGKVIEEVVNCVKCTKTSRKSKNKERTAEIDK